MHVLIALLAAFTMVMPLGHPSTDRPDPDRTCFSKSLWSAEGGVRPCVRVLRVEEDGAFKASVMDANGTERYTIGVGNPTE